jgi:hypothetical protein
MAFRSRDEAMQYHAASVNAGSKAASPYEGAYLATESFWRSAHPGDGRARMLFGDIPRIEAIVRSMTCEKCKPADVLERALWQRDLICTLQAILHCQETENKSLPSAGWQGAKQALISYLRELAFNLDDLDQLHRRLSRAAGSAPFARTCRGVLSDDYLPPVVFGPAAHWLELPSDQDPGLHYQAYGGRNFTRVFMMVPGMEEADFFRYWAKVTRRFGMNVTVSAAVPRLPPGTQTVLLRTFGVFLNDGSYADSRIPEEVLVRIFKYSEAKLDPDTSDGLGTLHYQYKLRRHQLLNDPASLGLCRTRDADGQFYGFFAEVPETSSTEHLTTMRANCISCHSEVLYGASTIFSLCRRSPAKPGAALIEGGALQRIGPESWLIKQEPLQLIQKELMSRPKAAS